MKGKNSSIKLVVAAMGSALLLSNCVTSYDSYGRPIQTVDPGAVAVGALVLGAVAYSAGKDNRSHRRNYHRGHYRPSHSYPHGHGHRYHR